MKFGLIGTIASRFRRVKAMSVQEMRRQMKKGLRQQLQEKQVADRTLEIKPKTSGPTLFSQSDIKETVRQSLEQKEYDVRDFYRTKGIWQRVARHPVFDAVSLNVVTLNTLWMGVDADFNGPGAPTEGHALFPFMENAFCAFFFTEWFVRFKAFRRKRDGLKDRWFVFDTVLVFMMVMETWVMPLLMGGGGGSQLGILRLARLLRLTRVARMARVFRAVPELLILIKGMMVAVRSVGTTLLLLLILIYIFALIFRQIIPAGSVLGQLYFSSISSSMYTLMLNGIFMDNIGSVVADIAQQSPMAVVLFWVFVLISSLTVMNMLIAVICEAVSNVAATEKELLTANFVKQKMQLLFEEIDESGDGLISRDEFLTVLTNPKATQLLTDVGLDVIALIDSVDALFISEDMQDGGKERQLSFVELVELVLSLRGSCVATVKDVIDLRKFTRTVVSHTSDQLTRVETHLEKSDERMQRIEEHMRQIEGGAGAGKLSPQIGG